jgi:hypothetical protein
VRERRPPFSPADVVLEFVSVLKSYGIRKVTGDRWGGEFVREPFRAHGIEYAVAEMAKSNFYREALPLLTSSKVELLDHPRLVTQFCGLERRTSRAGKDSIDHGPNQHDDLVNVVAIAIVLAAGGAGPIIITCQMVEQIRQAGRYQTPFRRGW